MTSELIQIVRFEEPHFDKLADLYCRVWATAEAYSEVFTIDDVRNTVNKLSDLWVLCVADQTVGFVGGMPLDKYDNPLVRELFREQTAGYYIDELGIDPTLQRRGFGAQLLAHSMEQARTQGFRAFVLKTATGNRNRAPRLYARHGFQVLRDREGLPVRRKVRQTRRDGRDPMDERVYFFHAAPGELVEQSQFVDPRFASTVAGGLLRPAGSKTLSCEYFYDAPGAAIFSEICDLPEYYPTRTEAQLLSDHVHDIVGLVGERTSVVELGPGDGRKTRVLLARLLRKGHSISYFPIDVAKESLQQLCEELQREYPMVDVCPVVGTYSEGLTEISSQGLADPALLLWLGTSVGNLEPLEAEEVLRACRQVFRASGLLVLGADLKKERVVLERAYDDSKGVTARFNLNILARINRELGGNFDLASFRHRAIYNEAMGRVEMHLVSVRAQTIRIRDLGISVEFEADESIHTENSYKFSRGELDRLANDSGFSLAHHFVDPGGQFSLNVLVPTARDVRPR